MPSRIRASLEPPQAPLAPQTPNLGDIYRQEGLLAAILQAFSPQALIQLFAQDPALGELPGPSPLAVNLPPNMMRLYRMQYPSGNAYWPSIMPQELLRQANPAMPAVPGGRFFTSAPQEARGLRGVLGQSPEHAAGGPFGYFVDLPQELARSFAAGTQREFVLPPWIAQQATRVRRNVQQVPTNIPQDIPARLP